MRERDDGDGRRPELSLQEQGEVTSTLVSKPTAFATFAPFIYLISIFTPLKQRLSKNSLTSFQLV